MGLNSFELCTIVHDCAFSFHCLHFDFLPRPHAFVSSTFIWISVYMLFHGWTMAIAIGMVIIWIAGTPSSFVCCSKNINLCTPLRRIVIDSNLVRLAVHINNRAIGENKRHEKKGWQAMQNRLHGSVGHFSRKHLHPTTFISLVLNNKQLVIRSIFQIPNALEILKSLRLNTTKLLGPL